MVLKLCHTNSIIIIHITLYLFEIKDEINFLDKH